MTCTYLPLGIFVDEFVICKNICDKCFGIFAVVAPKSRLDEVVNSFAANPPNVRQPGIDGISRLEGYRRNLRGNVLVTTSPL